MPKQDREKWDQRHARAGAAERKAPAWLDQVASRLPDGGRALDVAAGTGRISRWLVRRGYAVWAVDVSPVGLATLARREPTVHTVEQDLVDNPVLPPGPFSLITCFCYRQPDLWPHMRAALGPGGCLVAEIATTGNLERHGHPSARWLVEPGEVAEWASGLELLHYEEGWLNDICSARLVARKSAPEDLDSVSS